MEHSFLAKPMVLVKVNQSHLLGFCKHKSGTISADILVTMICLRIMIIIDCSLAGAGVYLQLSSPYDTELSYGLGVSKLLLNELNSHWNFHLISYTSFTCNFSLLFVFH